jgi:hypothetical protein
MNKILKTALPIGMFAVSALLAPPPASALTASGFTAFANVADSACMDKWATQVDNACSRQIQVHFDLATTASPDHFFAHVWAGSGQTISCWGESYDYAMDGSHFMGPTLEDIGLGSLDMDLGTVSIMNTHNIVCNMGPGTAVHSVDG